MNKKMDKKRFFKKIITLVAAGLIVGCAASPKPEPSRTALGKWHSQNINADGSKADWPGSAPQYKDSEIDTKIWISNNAEQLCLLAEVNDPGIARQLTQNGLILSMETGEKNAKPFSIQLKCHASFKLPDTLVVTYPFSSGPVTMSMTEARTTGIALGLTEAGRHTLIFEAVISLDAIFFDVPRIAGAVMNIALSAKSNSFAIKRRENLEGKKHDRPKGESPDQGSSDTSHGPGKPDDMKQTKASDDPFRAAVEITLAGPAK